MFEFNYEDIQVLCDDLLSHYDSMSRALESFSNCVEGYKEMVDDRIMGATGDAMALIRENLEKLNEYITGLTERKQDSAHEMEEIEKSKEEEVRRIGG